MRSKTLNQVTTAREESDKSGENSFSDVPGETVTGDTNQGTSHLFCGGEGEEEEKKKKKKKKKERKKPIECQPWQAWKDR